MSTSMRVAFDAAKTVPGKGNGKGTPQADPKPRLSLADLRGRLAAVLNRNQSEALSEDDKLAKLAEYRELKTMQAEVTRQIDLFGAKDAASFASREAVNTQLQELQVLIRGINENVSDLEREFPFLVEEAIRSGRMAETAQALSETVSSLNMTTPTDDVVALIGRALKAQLIMEVPNGHEATGFTWTHKKNEKYVEVSYAATSGDPAVQDAVGRLAGYIQAKTANYKANKEQDRASFGRFIISPEDRNALSREDGTSRSVKAFLKGEGTTFILPVEGERDGQPQFMGMAVLKRVNGKIVVVFADNLGLAKKVFRVRKDNEFIVRDRPYVLDIRINNGQPDFSELRSDLFRTALNNALANEAKSDETREAAQEIRDLDNINDLTTYEELRATGEGTYVFDVRGRNRLTFRLVGLGPKSNAFQVTDLAPGATEKCPELVSYTGKASLTQMDNNFFRKLREGNAYIELATRVKLGKAEPVNKDNINDLFGVEGKDGFYGIRTTWMQKNFEDRDKPDAKRFPETITYILERAGDQIKVAWAAPGLSARLVSRLRETAESFPVTDLPGRLREVSWNVYKAVAGYTNVPTHLQRQPKADKATGEATPTAE